MATMSENVSAATRSMAGDVFEELLERFRNENPTFRISDDVIRRYHLATSTRGFVILCGPERNRQDLAGPGLREARRRPSEARRGRPELVVQRGPARLPLARSTASTTTRPFSEFVPDAAREWNSANQAGRLAREFHVILDEMNLARVEHYFSRFLSAMEVRTREGVARLDLAPGHTVELTPEPEVLGHRQHRRDHARFRRQGV